MEQIVTGCSDCPYLYDYIQCTHPADISDEEYAKEPKLLFSDFKDGESPAWCPLNKEPITIIKK